jgi:two-component system, cell cycle sensor histidine kinase and response regulator CckA
VTGVSPFQNWSAASPYALALGLAAVVCTSLAVVGWRRHVRPGGLHFALMMAAAALWALLYSFELTTPSFAGKVFWAKTEYVGIAVLPLAWLLFARSYTGAIRRVPRGLVALVALIPALTVVLAATNGFHHLVWSTLSLGTSGPFPILALSHGPWFWVHVTYSYALLAAGSVVLARTALKYPQLYRRQLGMLMVAIVAPWVGNGLSIFRVLPGGGVDVTPFAFALTGVALLLAMSRFRLLSLLPALLPAAHNQVLETMRDGVFVLDVDGRVVSVNPAASDMLGLPASRIRGQSARGLLGEQFSFGSGEEPHSQFELSLGEGALGRSYDVVSSPLALGGGIGVGRLLVLRDITERKQMEESLRLTQYCVEGAADLIHWIDPAGRILFANEASCRRTGYSAEEMSSLRIFDLDPALSYEGWRDIWQRLTQADSLTVESVHRTKTGELYPVEVSSSHVRQGGKEYCFAFARDISERAEAMQALLASKERYRMLFDNANDGIVIHDLEGAILEANRVVAERLGYKRDELVEMTVSDLRTPEAAGPLILQMAEILKKGHAIFETAHRHRDGSPVPVEVSSRLLDDGGRQVVLSISRDIRERKEAEMALRRSEEQLRQSQKMEAVGQLAGGIAHDFNNLLTTIIGNSSLALDAMDTEDRNRELVIDVHEAGARAAGLTKQILAFSRRQILKPEIVCLNGVVGGMEPLLRRTLGEDIDLQLALASQADLVEVDPHQIEQVLLNLAVNARDAMPGGGSLSIETANVRLDRTYSARHPEVKPGTYVLLAVTDTGCGMDIETKSHAFEPFFTTKELGKGTGLGLSTVFGIIKQSGGSISVYSELGRGSTFRVYLPASRATIALKGESVREEEVARGVETVLVVEDEISVRQLVCRVLAQVGYQVLEAGNAPEVEALLADKTRSLDLLLTDVVLPGGRSGREVAELLAARHPSLPTIFMSGYTRASVVHNGRLDEGIEFLEKPFSPAALLTKVRAVLDRELAQVP